jgi:hypothetical protein
MRFFTAILVGLALWGAVAFAGMMIGQPFPDAAQVNVNLGGCPAAPAAAVRAGFTACIANYDWTGATQSSVNGSNITLGAPANWLECAGAAGSARQWQVVNYIGKPAQPCSNVTVKTDPVYGGSVLDLTYTPSSSLGGMAIMTTDEPGGTGSSSTNTTIPFSITHPTAMYIEFRERMASWDITNYPWVFGQGGVYVNGNFADTWSWYTAGGYIEYDFMEYYSNPVADASTQDYYGRGQRGLVKTDEILRGAFGSGVDDMSEYHTIGMRITTDGATGIGISHYLDGRFTNGGSFVPGAGSAAYDDPHYLIINDGEQGTTLGQACNRRSPYTCKPHKGPIDSYYQWVHIYSCSVSGPCYASILTNAP